MKSMTVLRPAAIAGAIAASALVSTGSNAQPGSPLVEFMGKHYVITQSEIDAFLGIAFDAASDRVVSDGSYTICGDLIVAAHPSDSGMAWDPVTERVWYISTGTRDVYYYDSASPDSTRASAEAAPTVVFTIPLTFDVPGVGPAALESPQGLAIDDTHVYVIDAGPDPGQIDSNEWFKFTRDGTPVSSSAVTDFVASIDAPVDDAIADGITWCPSTCPTAPGLFLVAFEHTGIMVIDENGFFVDDLTWEDAGLPYGIAVPAAFAGITVDPATGDIYLVENDFSGTPCHVWVRVPDDEPVLLGNGNTVHYPDLRCARQLLRTGFPDGLVFGAAYRDVDDRVWGMHYNTGDIIKTDPRSGQVLEVVPNDGWVVNNWGIAYDDERDDIYFYGTDDQIHVFVDPDNPDERVLPNRIGADFPGTDIAFNSDDGQIYLVAEADDTSWLMRVDRDTGVGVIVGFGLNTYGLAYDDVSGVLYGIVREGGVNKLHSFDTVTGDPTFIADLPGARWEGLTVLRPTDPILGIDGLAPASVTLASPRVAPNPFATRTTISFDLAHSGSVRVEVFDVTGRLVRRIPSRTLGAGRHHVAWDGRTDGGGAAPAGVYFVHVDDRVGATRASTVLLTR